MIEVTIEEISLWVVAVTLVIIGLLIFGRHSRENQIRRRRKRAILHCPACNHIFEDLGNVKLVTCPRCGRDTQRGRDKSLG